MLKRVEGPSKDVQSLILAALVIGLSAGFIGGIVGSAPAHSPNRAYNAAQDLCTAGYSVWNADNMHVCGPGRHRATHAVPAVLNPDEMAIEAPVGSLRMYSDLPIATADAVALVETSEDGQ